MKPPIFDYVAPETLDEAVAALVQGDDETKVLAGGQSLVPLLAFRFAQPSLLVDLNRVRELAYVRETADGGLAVGAMTRTHDSRFRRGRDPLAARRHCSAVHRPPTDPQPRDRRRQHRTRRPAAELPSVALASHVTLIARGPRGSREIPASEFFVTYFTTALESDEVLAEIRVPPPAPNSGVAFAEAARRHGDFALVGVSATVELNPNGCSDACIVLVGVGDRPVEVTAAPEILRGNTITEVLAREAGEAASAAINPTSDLHASATYRKEVARVLTRRALLDAAAKAARG